MSALSSTDSVSKRFLRFYNQLEIGDYIPNIELTNSENKQVKIYDLISNHLVIVLLSNRCDACMNAIETLEVFTRENNANIVVLIETSDDIMQYLNSIFSNRSIVFFPYSTNKIKYEFHTFSIPRFYAVNCFGQIVASEPGGSMRTIANIQKPFTGIIKFSR